MHSYDRILELEVIDGKDPSDGRGLTDSRLFTGDNRLHAVMDTATCLWFLKYERGAVPPALKMQFTSFSSLLKHVKAYFVKRNINIKAVIDSWPTEQLQ